MCGITGFLGDSDLGFDKRTLALLKHRGPDDNGVFKGQHITLLHARLSILDISAAGHQPMVSSCGRYVICFNGEIYNHRDLRKKYLSGHIFKSDSDTETIVELFRIKREDTVSEMVGMWSILIWDIQQEQLFVSRDRYGQKPLYYKQSNGQWVFSSEIKPLLNEGQSYEYEPTALTEFLALGNYGHLGDRTFFKDIRQFPQGAYTWLKYGDTSFEIKKYWELPFVHAKDKRPFDEQFKKELHDSVVEAVLSQTLSDVPIGITLSGGIDSSIIAGILATHYNKNINVFTAQSVGSAQDESKYVDAVVKMYPEITLHKRDLKSLSLKEDVYKYINIQEEPFGDPSIIAHGSLMEMAANSGVKVILGGQGADELFFGYNNMVSAVLLRQVRALNVNTVLNNLKKINVGKSFIARTLFMSVFPGWEKSLRTDSRNKRRNIITADVTDGVDDELFRIPNYGNMFDVWKESVYGIHLPHLVHYDDRNAMAYSIEGRMPFLDHRIAELVAQLKPEYLYKDGLRKYPLREACGQYLPDIIKNRTDKIGFYTPLLTAIYNDAEWISLNIKDFIWIKNEVRANLLNKIGSKTLDISDALLIWRFLITNCWKEVFNITA